MAEHNLIGKKGEENAIKYLQANGYKIRHCNWRFKKNEIDIICEENNLLVVVEVKTRTSEYFENPKEAVTKKKQKSIIKATEAYIFEFDIQFETRFDIISVTIIGNQMHIEHIKDAYQPSLLI